jgi:hypothetical protein
LLDFAEVDVALGGGWQEYAVSKEGGFFDLNGVEPVVCCLRKEVDEEFKEQGGRSFEQLIKYGVLLHRRTFGVLIYYIFGMWRIDFLWDSFAF